MRKIGITTTIPSEIIYSAGAVPVDLNNIFITSPIKGDFVYSAEKDSIHRNWQTTDLKTKTPAGFCRADSWTETSLQR